MAARNIYLYHSHFFSFTVHISPPLFHDVLDPTFDLGLEQRHALMHNKPVAFLRPSLQTHSSHYRIFHWWQKLIPCRPQIGYWIYNGLDRLLLRTSFNEIRWKQDIFSADERLQFPTTFRSLPYRPPFSEIKYTTLLVSLVRWWLCNIFLL